MPESIPLEGLEAAAGSGRGEGGILAILAVWGYRVGSERPPRRGGVSAVPCPMELRLGQGQGGVAHTSTSKSGLVAKT